MFVQYLESRGVSRRAGRALVLSFAAALLVLVMVLEWIFALDYSLGVFYVVPVTVSATVLNSRQMLLVAILCAWMRSLFTPGLPFIEFWLRFIMAVLAYGGVGVLVSEVSRNRREVLAALARLQTERDLRRHAEDQLRILVDSSPAAIMTLNQKAEVLAANRAAHEMLGFEPESLIGICLAQHLPVFAGALRVASDGAPVRVSSNCWAQRANGTHFPAAVWFSTYEEFGQRRLAGILVDSTEEVRDREHEMLRHMADSNRLLAGAVAHEIRNLCSAINVVTTNLRRHPEISQDADFGALNTLVESLMRIAAFELSIHQNSTAARVDLARVLEELRVVIELDWAESSGEIEWDVPEMLPYVHADKHALLQVFLNLSQNSLRAVQLGGSSRLRISATADNGRAIIAFHDAGPGVSDPEILFQPFRENADGSGLGLYVSRAMMRGFGGDLVHVPVDHGSRFDLVLPTYDPVRSPGA